MRFGASQGTPLRPITTRTGVPTAWYDFLKLPICSDSFHLPFSPSKHYFDPYPSLKTYPPHHLGGQNIDRFCRRPGYKFCTQVSTPPGCSCLCGVLLLKKRTWTKTPRLPTIAFQKDRPDQLSAGRQNYEAGRFSCEPGAILLALFLGCWRACWRARHHNERGDLERHFLLAPH